MNKAARELRRTLRVVLTAVVIFVPFSGQVHAQERDDDFSQPYSEIIGWLSPQEVFDPVAVGMTTLGNPGDLFAELVKSGRCDSRGSRARKVCAFVSYAPASTLMDAWQASLRPVFRVESDRGVWTVLYGQIARVSIARLHYADDLSDDLDPDRADAYPATALIGIEENRLACEAGRACADLSHFDRIEAQVGILSDGCIDEIWNARGGPRAPGDQSRCRFLTDRSLGGTPAN